MRFQLPIVRDNHNSYPRGSLEIEFNDLHSKTVRLVLDDREVAVSKQDFLAVAHTISMTHEKEL